MNKITILVGESISSLEFSCGGYPESGLYDGTWFHFYESVSHKCPEVFKHPKFYKKYLEETIGYTLKNWNLLISTNSEDTLNIVADLVEKGVLLNTQVEVIGVCENNQTIIFNASIDEEGYFIDFPLGFMSIY